MYLEEGIAKINTKLTVLNEKVCVAIWGASENTVRLFQYTDISRYNIKMIIDNEKCGSTFIGKVVVSSDEMDWRYIDAVVISAFYREDEIFDQLINQYKYSGTIIRLNWEGQEKPFYQHLLRADIQIPLKYRNIVQDNKKFFNIHKGKRCFVLCNGPSINLLDLKKIKGEYSIAVSNFYMHKDYNIIKPDYYCNTKLYYEGRFTKEVGRKYFEKIEENAGDTQYFFSITEKEMIEQYEMYMRKRVNYLYFSPIGQEYEEVDLTLKTMEVQSMPIMCLELAIYMGFSEIYLIGTEHSELTTNKYNYFYDRKDNANGYVDNSTDKDGNLIGSYERFLPCIYRLWEQYKIMKRIAERKGIKIYNATAGGQLDIFERVDYNTLF